MFTYLIPKATTDVSVVIRIVDSTDGTPETAVEHNTTGIDLEYRREGAVSTDITEVALAALTTAHTDGGIEHIGNGYYRLDLPDAACATGVDGVLVHGTVTGMVVIGCYIHLTNVDIFDGVRMGMTALPNAAADAAGGLPISDAGALDLDARLDAAVSSRLAPTVAARTLDVTTGGAAGIDWGNVENPTTTVDLSATDINLVDTCTTNTDMRGTDNAALASVLGALADAAAAGDPTSADTVMQYLKQLINVLVGTTGVATFPAEAAPANNVSLSEVLRAIHADVTGLNGDVMRGTDSAALATVCTEARLAELDAANLPATTDNIETDTQDIQGRIPAVGPVEGTADSGSTTTMVDAVRTEGDDYWNGAWILFTSGTLNGVCRLVTDFVASTDTLTFAPAAPAAVSTHTYRMIPAAQIEEVLALTGHTVQTGDSFARLGAPAGASVSADIATVDTVVDGIQTDLDNGTDGLGAIKTTADAIETDTQDIQSRLPAALVSGKMDADATAISGDTTAADRLEGLMDGVILAQVNDASATTTAFAADGFTEATDDHFNGRLITFVTGNLTGQQTDITDYDAAGHAQGSQALVVTALTEAPANDDWFIIH